MNDDEFHDSFQNTTIILFTTISFNGSPFLWDEINFSEDRLGEKENSSIRRDGNGSLSQLAIRIFPQQEVNNYWALLALVLVFGTAAGNILVCLAITWERRLQNVTNYFLMSLAITDLMVAILVMPLGILTLVYGYFPLQSEHCLVWICLDVLFCTASIMHLCTISVDRYLSLRYPMTFGRNKTRRRVILKIIFVWLLSIAMSLPLSLMYSQDHASVLVKGTCQIPDPVYKLVGSIVSFYIPLGVMLLTYYLTVRLLARQRQNLGGSNSQASGWTSGWLGQAPISDRRCTWRRLLKTGYSSTPNYGHSATSTDTELSTLDNHEFWLPESSIPEPTPSTMTALHQFGTEMLKLSRGLESVGSSGTSTSPKHDNGSHNRMAGCSFQQQQLEFKQTVQNKIDMTSSRKSPLHSVKHRRSLESVTISAYETHLETTTSFSRKRYSSLPINMPAFCKHEKNTHDNISQDNESNTNRHMSIDKNEYLELPPCTCRYFGICTLKNTQKPTDVKIISSTYFRSNCKDSQEFAATTAGQTVAISNNKTSLDATIYLPLPSAPIRKLSYSKTASVLTWNTSQNRRRGSSFGGVRTSLLLTPNKVLQQTSPLRRSATLKNHNTVNVLNGDGTLKAIRTTPSSPCLLQRNATVRSHHSRNSSVISRNSSRHGRIIRLEQKATKVLGVVFFTFVILWAPFFVLNLLPTVCEQCEQNISHWVFEVVTWLGYASSMVNPIFYTIFNKVFRQAFKKVLACKYGRKSNWRPNR